MADVEILEKQLAAFKPDPQTGLLQPLQDGTEDSYHLKGANVQEITRAFEEADIIRSIHGKICEYTTSLNQETSDDLARQQLLASVFEHVSAAQTVAHELAGSTPVDMQHPKLGEISQLDDEIVKGLGQMHYHFFVIRSNPPVTVPRHRADFGAFLSTPDNVRTLLSLDVRMRPDDDKPYGHVSIASKILGAAIISEHGGSVLTALSETMKQSSDIATQGRTFLQNLEQTLLAAQSRTEAEETRLREEAQKIAIAQGTNSPKSESIQLLVEVSNYFPLGIQKDVIAQRLAAIRKILEENTV